MDTEVKVAYEEELEKLNRTTSWIDAKLKELQSIPRYYGNDYTEQALDAIREQARRQMGKATDEPYFGRMDFQESGTAKVKPLYIGKFGVENDDTSEPLIIDWRAPIASLFYSFTGGEDPAAYDSPDGIIDGLVYLKRNLVIRKQLLQRVVDTYARGGDQVAVNDEFLLYRLGENKDNKLRDIVSTIQAEQDRIIRSARQTAMVIQGVAGSGKTTVALHRLAFLLYQYRDIVKAERMIIFAPNQMFLDYISSVLPELGVGSIQQTTFADWAFEVLEEDKLKLADPTDTLANWFAPGAARPEIDDYTPGRFKGWIGFQSILDEALDRYEAHFMPEGDFEPWPMARLRTSTIREWFTTEYRHYPLYKRKERVHARIKRWIEMELDLVRDPGRRKEFKSKASVKLRTYMKTWPDHTPFRFYADWLGGKLSAGPGSMPSPLPASISAVSLKGLAKKIVQPEDLAPLLHVHDRFYGIDSDRIFDHIVIDEAQDFSPFQVALLNRHVKSGSFTILGDLSQGIHAYQGVLDWNEMLGLFPAGTTAFHQLERSYRSTMEIIRFANVVLERSVPAAVPAIPVFRSGEKVRLLPTPAAARIGAIADAVARSRAGEATTVAVIGRTERECEALHRALLSVGIEATLIGAGERRYSGGVSVLAVYLAKGLEFDAVILVDVDETRYSANVQDGKLLYVGCTRALHQLWIHYEGRVSPLVETEDTELVEDVSST
ncbi:HelD family protein [Paenibacillus koleovorans]|uniref:HelD family protein n=1 Tax=Paenibacillus koleovorans TaxID=121608 RepID=UPI000FD79EF1|nr:3'-5' exonuclease [Paenibacillus koleovorans]